MWMDEDLDLGGPRMSGMTWVRDEDALHDIGGDVRPIDKIGEESSWESSTSCSAKKEEE